MSQPKAHGNRLEVPANFPGAHFFYKTAAPVFDPKDTEAVVAVAKSYRMERLGHKLDVISEDHEAFESEPEAQDAFCRLTRAIEPFTRHAGDAELAVCEWSAPHVDIRCLGFSFYSVVLHTGPQPYLMQTMHTEPHSGGCADLIFHREILAVGEAFVFDPTTIHMAFPLKPHQDQLLILLQVQLDDRTLAEREALTKLLPVCVPYPKPFENL